MTGLLILSNSCEDLEAVGTKALLERAGLKIKTATFHDDKTILCSYGTKVIADLDAKTVNPDEFDFLVIPGGIYVTRTIKTDTNIKPLIKAFSDQNKLISAICAAPMYFGEMGLLKGRNYTIFPACNSDSYQGEYKRHRKTVRDGNIITGRSVGAVTEFAYEIVKYLLGSDKADSLLDNIYY